MGNEKEQGTYQEKLLFKEDGWEFQIKKKFFSRRICLNRGLPHSTDDGYDREVN